MIMSKGEINLKYLYVERKIIDVVCGFYIAIKETSSDYIAHMNIRALSIASMGTN